MVTKCSSVRSQIRTEWSPEVLQEVKRLGKKVSESAKRDRVDLRELPLVTIDGITARDFDDAVYCERRGKNWRSGSVFISPDALTSSDAAQPGATSVRIDTTAKALTSRADSVVIRILISDQRIIDRARSRSRFSQVT